VSIGVFSAVAPLGTLSIANIEAIRTATTLYALIVIKGERLNALTNDTVTSIGRLPGRSNQRIVLYRIGTDYQVGWGNDNEGTTLMDIASAALDPDATYVIRVGSANGSGANASARMFRRDGTPAGVPVLAEDTAVIGNFGATTSGAQEWGVLAGSWRPELDGFAWFTSKPADATICANPAVGMSGCVSLCTFESPLADAQSGATLTSSDVTIASGGTWDLLPRLTAPASGAALTVAQGDTLSQGFTIDRRGNTNTLTVRAKSGTFPSGASMANVTVTNPGTTGTGSIEVTVSAPTVTADPIEFELVDGSTVLHTLACTLTITEAVMGTGSGGASGKIVEQGGSPRVFLTLRNATTGARLTSPTVPLRVAAAGSSTFNARTATYDGEAGEFFYDLTPEERAIRAVARIIPQAPASDETIEIAIIERGALFTSISSMIEKLSTLATGVSAVMTAGPFQTGAGRLSIATFNAFTASLPVFLVGTGRTVIAKFCESREGDPPAINAAVSITLTEGLDTYSGTIARSAINAHLTAFVGESVFLHIDDGVGYHSVQEYFVTDARPTLI
jgi:hypothetical protein